MRAEHTTDDEDALAAERIAAAGLAMPFPMMSGAEPCTCKVQRACQPEDSARTVQR